MGGFCIFEVLEDCSHAKPDSFMLQLKPISSRSEAFTGIIISLEADYFQCCFVLTATPNR